MCQKPKIKSNNDNEEDALINIPTEISTNPNPILH